MEEVLLLTFGTRAVLLFPRVEFDNGNVCKESEALNLAGEYYPRWREHL
jgi:hypothetical protein